MNVFRKVLLVILLVSVLPASGVAAVQQPEIAKLQIDPTPAANARQLAERSSLVVEVLSDGRYQSFPTSQRIGNRQVVNYVQTLQVKQVLKGSSPSPLQLLSRGVEPLPDARDPLNDSHPGPLAEGDYVIFLHPVQGTHLYSITGLWQGVYPVYDGKTVALGKFGFLEYNQLELKVLKEKIR